MQTTVRRSWPDRCSFTQLVAHGPTLHHVRVDPSTRSAEHPAPAPARGAAEHLVTTLARGSFVHATCALCAWDGPGRRALSTAERDAAKHLAG